jgi:NADPH:quinone reductase-like Zn-dependent oxidoreductase
MSPSFNNEAAWIETEKANPLVVGPGPTPSPGEDEIVIKVAYATVNPTDYKVSKQRKEFNIR